MIRILHIMGCADAGGISSVVRNYYQFMDRTRFHFDIALTVPEAGQNARALEAMGAKIYFLPLKLQDYKGFRDQLTKLLVEGKYDGIHVHESETCYVALRIAKKLGIPCRIAHAHITSPYEGFGSELRRLSGCVLNYPYASHVIGCGQLAGERIFGKGNMKKERAMVLPNAVDLQRFTFDPAVRQETRKELGVEGKYVLGMVARLDAQKNIPYAIDLMDQLRDRLPDAVLLIAGNGDDREMLETKILDLGLSDRVRLLGRRSDVERLYQAFDLFLLPSLYEGYPVAAVEALSSGLPALLSTKITGELQGFRGVTYIPLKDRKQWLEKIESYQKDPDRAQRQGEPARHGLDIRSTAKVLERVYEQDTGKA